MPEAKDTLLRLFSLLRLIPEYPRYSTTPTLHEKLRDRGFYVDLRTVQRDLQMLREHLPLEVRDDSKPHGWGWQHQPPDGVAGMGTSEALMVALVERHLQAALPASMLETFKPTFDRARRRLARLGAKAGASSWVDKVAATQPALVGKPPKTERAVREAIAEALLLEHKPQVVILELGGNDALRGLPLEMTEQNLRAMAQAARAAGARVLVVGMQVPPNYGAAYGQRFANSFVQVAKAEKAALVPFLLKGVADNTQDPLALFQADRIHPNERAQPLMLANVWPVLQGLLKP